MEDHLAHCKFVECLDQVGTLVPHKAELAQVGTFFPARISALASKMGQIKKM